MSHAVWILLVEAIVVYVLVLGAHALRHRFGLAHFYALIGGLTAVMSWVTDAGVRVEFGGVTFLIGSTVFYTSLLLGVFVVYVFDGPRATRVAISTVVGVSVIVPLIATVLHVQMTLTGHDPLGYVPIPSPRINAASVAATLMDLIFLAICWEFLGRRNRSPGLGLRSFLTLLGVMWVDVLLFNTGAFLGEPQYLAVMQGALLSRFFVSILAAPILWGYLVWQNRVRGIEVEQRPVLAILQQIAEIRQELDSAHEEIAYRRSMEAVLMQSEERYRRLIESANEAIVVIREGWIVFYNRKAVNLFGYEGEELLARPYLDFVHPDDRQAVRAWLEERLRDRDAAVQLEFRLMDDRLVERWAEANDVLIEWEGEPAVLSFIEDVTLRKEEEGRLWELATTDGLTGLFNRRHFLEQARREFFRARRFEHAVTALMVDVDHFKSYNDNYGHDVGDEVLRELAAILRSQTRDIDILGRYGGEEFIILLPETDLKVGLEAGERLRRLVEKSRIPTRSGELTLTVSVGVASSKAAKPDLERLITLADEALYEAKESGRNRVAASTGESAAAEDETATVSN